MGKHPVSILPTCTGNFAACVVALPSLAAALDILGDDGAGIAPILITVDPARDTPEPLLLCHATVREDLVDLRHDVCALAGRDGD